MTSAQMRADEEAAIAAGSVTGRELMERAGRGVVEAVLAAWPERDPAPKRAVILCGPGNNGGDGFVVARLLRDRGWQVAAHLQGDPDALPPDARANCDRWRASGALHRIEDAPRDAGQAEVFVDALFGTGLARPLQDAPRDWAAATAADPALRARTVAVDMPSGLCSDSGRALTAEAATVHAALTVTFHRPKIGHFLAAGPQHCGRLRRVDIGLGPATGSGLVRLLGGAGPGLAKTGDAHKYAHGHALILAGGPGDGGAARLSARGALRIGAGLVTVACPLSALQENAARLDTVMLRPLHDGAALGRLLDDRRLGALCLGPGMGHDRARAMVPVALASGRAAVLDADALSAYGNGPEVLFAMLHEGCVLTPHGGEFARLFPDIAARLDAPARTGPAYSKVDAARAAAARAGCVVLFKGPDTVIAAPDGRCAINAAHYDRAAPWLATAGSGDVLAGFVAGLLARGFEPMAAAEAAAWLHVECARAFGPGLIAEDLPEMLPRILRDLDL